MERREERRGRRERREERKGGREKREKGRGRKEEEGIKHTTIMMGGDTTNLLMKSSKSILLENP